MAAAYCRRCCFFKLLCFVTLFVQYLDKHNSICSPPSTFKGPFSVSRKLFSASRCGQDLAVARRSTKLPITKWSKHGSTVAALSERGFIKDLSIAVDVEINPGPEILTTCRLLHFKLQDLDFLSVDVIYFNFAPVVLRLNWIIILFIA